MEKPDGNIIFSKKLSINETPIFDIGVFMVGTNRYKNNSITVIGIRIEPGVETALLMYNKCST